MKGIQFFTFHLKGLDDRDAKEVKLLGPVVAAAAAVTAEIPPEKRVGFEHLKEILDLAA